MGNAKIESTELHSIPFILLKIEIFTSGRVQNRVSKDAGSFRLVTSIQEGGEFYG